MLEIFKSMASRSEYIVSLEAEKKLFSIFQDLYAKRDNHFGNGRTVRNIFEKTIENQSNRIASVSQLTKEILTTIELQDIEDGL